MRRASFTGTKFGGGGKKLESESEGGQKFLPPNHLPFCPPERLDFKIRHSDFAQKMFELRSKNTASQLEKEAFGSPEAKARQPILGAKLNFLSFKMKFELDVIISAPLFLMAHTRKYFSVAR